MQEEYKGVNLGQQLELIEERKSEELLQSNYDRTSRDRGGDITAALNYSTMDDESNLYRSTLNSQTVNQNEDFKEISEEDAQALF